MADVIIPSGSPGSNGVFTNLKYGWPDDIVSGADLPLLSLPIVDFPSSPDTDGGYYWGGIQATVTTDVDLTLDAAGVFGIWTNTRVGGNFTRLWWSKDTDDDGFPLPLPTLEPGYYLIQFGSRTEISLLSFTLETVGPTPVELFFTHLVGTKED